jgi:hypothetical protein
LTDGLYIGATIGNPGSWQCPTLFAYDGTTLTQKWQYTEYPDSSLAVDCVWWSESQQALFMVCTRWTSNNRIVLKWVPGEAGPIVVKTGYNPISDPSNYDPATDTIEFGGKLYTLHTGSDQNPAFMTRCDPADVESTFETVLEVSQTVRGRGEGGLGIVGGELYAVIAESVYKSSTGESGEWLLVTDMVGTDYQTEMAGAKLDPTTGGIYFGAFKNHPSLLSEKRRQIWRVDGGGTALEYSEYVANHNDWAFVGIAVNEGDQPLAIQWMPHNTPDTAEYGALDIMRRQSDGSWELEEQFYPRPVLDTTKWPRLWVNQGAIILNGKLHLLLHYDTFTALVRRNSIGDWVKVAAFGPDGYGNGYHYTGAAMTIGPIITRRSRIQFIRIGK